MKASGNWLMRYLVRSRWALVLAVVAAAYASAQAPAVRRPSQGQAAWQFLHAILRAEYPAAYRRLAPEVRRGVTLAQFEAAARPLWKSGQRRQPEIELYKLGMRLGERGASRLFYSFSFASDSSRKPPPVLLEVTFRDTASRAVLGFEMRVSAKAPVKVVAPTVGKTKK